MCAVLILKVVLFVNAQTNHSQEIVATGGTFKLEKSVVAGGGNKMEQQQVNQNGTNGQAVAGQRSNGGQFTIYSGFWTPEELTPTAATAVVGGRVLTADGRGIRNVKVAITFPNGETQTTFSSSLGYYSFDEIPAGETYIFSVSAKRYSFSPATQMREISGDTEDINFIAAAN